jgi:hypothetical protein
MPSGGHEHDEDTVAAASFGDVSPPAPQAQSVIRPRDLQTALAPPAADAYGTKVFDNLGLGDFTPPQVARVGDLLTLRSYFLSQLGPRYLWIIKLTLIEWPTLSPQEKQLHVAMRKSFVASYTFGAEAILQHWLWKTLKNATRSFGPLLKVFATEHDATTTCGTDAWESIFPLFPPALTLTLTLLVSVSCFVGERTRTSYTEGCLYGGLFVCLSLYISFGTRSTSLRYQMVDAHFYLEIITPSTLCDV